MIIVHYHLFKNAGTSVDAMLRTNFGKGWFEQEFDIESGATNADRVAEFIREKPKLRVLSSHTALMPLPDLGTEQVFPIVFVRHPLLRLKSAYVFERKQGADTLGSRLARDHDFAGYIEALLETPGSKQVRNFQAHRLSFFDLDSDASQLARAQRAIRELPFIGLVEEYTASINRLSDLLRPTFPDFQTLITRENVTSDDTRTPSVRVEDIRAEIGDNLFDRTVRANVDDLVLYNLVADSYAAAAFNDAARDDAVSLAQRA